MKTLNVRELRSAIPNLAKTLEQEHELLLVSNGEPIARIVPVEQPRRFESLKWLRDMVGHQVPDSTALIREERDRR
jgi:antitoxin (DNA-binding transcriptional repressor) of toxin-antitoxin stability system